jgi:hypothetical protein
MTRIIFTSYIRNGDKDMKKWTREEAKKALRDCSIGTPSAMMTKEDVFLDKIHALGLIEFEEPKTKVQLLCEALGWRTGGTSEKILKDALDTSNLTLVRVIKARDAKPGCI